MSKLTEEEFYGNMERWIQADVKDWNRITLLAYFCYKYQFKNKNNPDQVAFKLHRAKNGIALSKELADFKKLFDLLAPENYSNLDSDKKTEIRTAVNWEIRNFINWIIDVKFGRTNKTVSGTGIFLHHPLINEFRVLYARHLFKEKKTDKFKMLISWCQTEANDIFNRHQLEQADDLKLIKRYADQYTLKEDSLERRVLAKAIEMNLLPSNNEGKN